MHGNVDYLITRCIRLLAPSRNMNDLEAQGAANHIGMCRTAIMINFCRCEASQVGSLILYPFWTFVFKVYLLGSRGQRQKCSVAMCLHPRKARNHVESFSRASRVLIFNKLSSRVLIFNKLSSLVFLSCTLRTFVQSPIRAKLWVPLGHQCLCDYRTLSRTTVSLLSAQFPPMESHPQLLGRVGSLTGGYPTHQHRMSI